MRRYLSILIICFTAASAEALLSQAPTPTAPMYRQIQQPMPIYGPMQGSQIQPLPSSHPFAQVPAQSIFRVNPAPQQAWLNQSPMLTTNTFNSQLITAPGWGQQRVQQFNSGGYVMAMIQLLKSPQFAMAMVLKQQANDRAEALEKSRAARDERSDRRAARRRELRDLNRPLPIYGFAREEEKKKVIKITAHPAEPIEIGGAYERKKSFSLDLAVSRNGKNGTFSGSLKINKTSGTTTGDPAPAPAPSEPQPDPTQPDDKPDDKPATVANLVDSQPGPQVRTDANPPGKFTPNAFMNIVRGKGLFKKQQFICESAGKNQCQGIGPNLAKINSDKFKNTSSGSRRKEFTDWLKPAAQHWGMLTGIPPSLIVAQAIEESGAGSSSRFRKQNNLFSIYCGKVGTIKTSLGDFDVPPVSCKGKGEAGHNSKMTTPSSFTHGLKYYLAYLTSKMKRLYPRLDSEIKKAKAKGPLEVANIDALLRVDGHERKIKCGGKMVSRPKYALTRYACNPKYRDNLASIVNKNTRGLDKMPCKDCMNEKLKSAPIQPVVAKPASQLAVK